MEAQGISKLDLKRRNRKAILRAIQESGSLSRVDIANRLSLTRAAVTIITNQLISQGVLQELGEAPVDREHLQKGRRKILIGINPNYKFVLGAVINENCLSVGLSNLAGEVLDKESMELSADSDQQDIISFIAATGHKMMKNSGLNAKQILGMGIGIVPSRWEQMRATVNENEVDFSKLRYMMELELNVPVCCENAIGLYAAANQVLTRSYEDNPLLICAGERCHSAAMIGRQVLQDNAIESGMTRFILRPDGNDMEGYPKGSVQAQISPQAVYAKVRANWSQESMPKLWELAGGDANSVDGMRLIEAYTAGDPGIVALMDEVTSDYALLLYNYAITHRSKRVFFQNYVHELNLVGMVQDKLNALTDSEQVITVEESRVNGNQAFLAGCMLAIDRLFFEQGGVSKTELMANEDA